MPISLPWTSTRSTAASHQLPSILTFFPRSTSALSQRSDQPRGIEDGIEVVPVEREDDSAKMLSPCQDESEKEVVFISKLDRELEHNAKPLPMLPGSKWSRLRTKYRVIAIVIIQILMILIVGLSLMSIKKKHHGSSNSEVPPESLASSAPAPADLPIRNGSFTLSLKTPQQQSSSCLANTNESAAWTCFPFDIRMDVFSSPSVNNQSVVNMVIQPSSNETVAMYGLQPLVLGAVNLVPSIDDGNPGYGWAYYFQATYNRTALVRERLVGRVGEISNNNAMMMNVSEVQEGERPWSCRFEDIHIEGYIYVSQNATGKSNDPSARPVLPYAVKLTEQRLADTTTTPYCTRMQYDSVHGVVPLSPPGERVNLKLSSSSSTTTSRSEEGDVVELAQKRREPNTFQNTCRCQWMVQ